MKKALLASLILHLLPLIFIGPKIMEEIAAEKAQSTGGSDKNEKKTTGYDVQVIEQIPGGDMKKEIKNFYYGLGISGEYVNTALGQVYQIATVYAGYNGEAAGLMAGDYIVTVNGSSPVVNDISGDGPKDLILVVVRGNITLTVITKRGRVLY